jgi:hypothetical protein
MIAAVSAADAKVGWGHAPQWFLCGSVDPLISDYQALLTGIRSLGPDALYCGCSALADAA